MFKIVGASVVTVFMLPVLLACLIIVLIGAALAVPVRFQCFTTFIKPLWVWVFEKK